MNMRLTIVALLLAGCASKPPTQPTPVKNDYIRPITEQPHTQFYTNHAKDRLLEDRILGPPALPRHGPFPLHVVPNTPAVSNWMTKAMAIEPKPMTNQIPGSTILTKITTTDKDGKQFTAELTLEGNSRVQATDKMAVVIFSINTTNWIIESCTNLLDGKWYPMASGTGGNTNNGALVIVDLKEDSAPIKFYRQRASP